MWVHFYYAVFLVETADGEPRPALPETDDAGFFSEDGLPELASGYGAQMPLLFKLYRGEVVGPYFDSPDAPGAQPT